MSTTNTTKGKNASPKQENTRLRLILVRHGESQNNIYHEISQKAFEENRVADPAITDRGEKQAQCVADYFQAGTNKILHDIDTIYVSPMRRTMQTALPLVNSMMSSNNHSSSSSTTSETKFHATTTTNMPKVQVWTDIYEISGVHDRGIGQPGMKRSEMQNEFPAFALPETVLEGKGWYDISLGRETAQHGKERCQQVWDRLCGMANDLEHSSSIVLVVHGDFINHLLQAAFGILQLAEEKPGTATQEKIWVFPTWNASITALDIPGHRSGTSILTQRPTLLFHNSVVHLPPELVKTEKLGKC